MALNRKVRKRKLTVVSREDVNIEHSDVPGVYGFFETILRSFRDLSFVVMISPLAVVCCGCIGLAAAPALFWYDWVNQQTLHWPVLFHYAIMGFALASAYMTYGVCLIFIVPAVNFLIPFRPKAFRGPWYSLAAIPWYIHNGLTYMVRYSFLEFVTPTPLNILFYRMMGMKIGRGVVINTTNISDPCLITLEDYVTVGGSATIFAHYGQKGYLVIAPVVVGRGTNIGLKASIMGGVTVGKNVTIKPHTAILPKSQIPDGETV